MPRLQKTLVDYLVIAISPALIMVMVASLVFYIFSVIYTGPHQVRLWCIFGLFVFAAVLIARISIEEGKERAWVFALPLGGVMMLAGTRFLDVGWFVNLAMIALIWWAAHKLTWDCTVIDDQQDASGEGLFQSLGIEPSGPTELPAGAAREPDEVPGGVSNASAESNRTWWTRWAEQRRQPHAPGRWVIYFAVAALPLFGMGQWFMTPNFHSNPRVRFGFLFMYLLSALALLVTTSFLGLRRYLRQRRLEMPSELAAVWLGAGAVLIVVLLVVCALLPRPRSHVISFDPSGLHIRSPDDLQPNQFAIGNDGPEDEEQGTTTRVDEKTGEGAPQKPGESPSGDSQDGKPSGPQSKSGDKSGTPSGGNQKSQDGQNKSSSSGSQPSPGGEKKSPSSSEQSGKGQRSQQGEKSQSGGQSSDPDPSKQNQSQRNSESEKGSENKSSDSSENKGSNSSENKSSDSSENKGSNSSENKSSDSSENKGSNSSENKSSDSSENKSSNSSPNKGSNSSASKRSGSQSGAPGGNRSKSASPRSTAPKPRTSPTGAVSQVLGGVGWLLRMVFYLALAAGTGWLIWRYRADLLVSLQKLLAELRDFWNRLFGGGQKPVPVETQVAQPLSAARRFSDFPNPFRSGLATRASMTELIRYSFEALEAWGREHDLPRDPDQTPVEFAQQVARHHPPLAGSSGKLAELYSLVTYSHAPAPASTASHLQQLWTNLEAATLAEATA